MKRIYNFRSLTGLVGISIFLAIEITMAVAAAVWAVAGFMKLGPTATYALGAVLGLPALLAIGKIVMLAFEAETDPANQ